MENNNLPFFVQNQQHKEKIRELREANEHYFDIAESLKAQVEVAVRQSEEAKKDARFSRIVSLVSVTTSVASVAINIIFRFFNV